MTEQTGGQPPAGWYPDGSGQLRYWDGTAWTEHVQPIAPEAAPAPQPVAQPVAQAAPTTPVAQPTTATQTYTLNCQPTTFPVDKYPFNLTLTVTPTEVSVSGDASIKNTGPSNIEIGAYRFDAAVTVNGTPLALTGPTNAAVAKGNDGGNELIFKSTEAPLVAKAALPAGTTGTPTVVLTDIYFNNIAGGNGTEALTDIFDSRCNASPNPNTAPQPIGLSVPPAAGGSSTTSVAPTTP